MAIDVPHVLSRLLLCGLLPLYTMDDAFVCLWTQFINILRLICGTQFFIVAAPSATTQWTPHTPKLPDAQRVEASFPSGLPGNPNEN